MDQQPRIADIATIIREWHGIVGLTPEQISDNLMTVGYSSEAACNLTALHLAG